MSRIDTNVQGVFQSRESLIRGLVFIFAIINVNLINIWEASTIVNVIEHDELVEYPLLCLQTVYKSTHGSSCIHARSIIPIILHAWMRTKLIYTQAQLWGTVAT